MQMVNFSRNGNNFECIFRAFSTQCEIKITWINQGNLEKVVKGISHRRLGDMQLYMYNLEMELYLYNPDITNRMGF